WQQALDRLLQESPELQIAQAEVVRDEIALRRELVEPIPNVNLRAATGWNFENQRVTTDASISVRIPLFDRNQGTIQQARADLARAHADVTRVELSLRQRLADAFAHYQNAWGSVEDYRKQSL